MTGAVLALPVRSHMTETPILSPTARRRYGTAAGLLEAAMRQLAGHVAAGRMSRGIAEAAIWNTVLRGTRTGELRGDAVAVARAYCERLRSLAGAA